ncbi:phosphoribosylamine--glycine ligase [Agaribacter marinus]|uniref:Phosphoribosylamine--glycine ligase n=1 Tax=Agaribacter marinus TaxID=1431249 RepID=A0AA37WKY8_9ALTE|nr:phosphoribosylamine--glycine ligase [Agaribacter marinus]GLR71465.1 phosphoribosylamine--glycine ligase [Agaribacter marinus]
MKVLVLGRGGREHALAYQVAKSDQVDAVYVADGNAGMDQEAKITRLAIKEDDKVALLAEVNRLGIELTIVGPEAPLSKGVVDFFEANGKLIFGPTQAAAQLETSKSYTKDFLARYDIPTGYYKTFEVIDEAIAYIKQQGAPIVVKADGLAAGKGVIVAMDEQTAIDAVTDMLSDNKFGDAGSRVVIEEFLDGEEASFIVLCDGKNVLPLATSQDHKRAYDNDEGPNTGGMGAYSPAPVVTQAVHDKIMQDVILPTMEGMAKEGNPYKGFLYAGLMIDSEGNPKVIEYNCRCGDPETQPIMMRMQSDLASLCVKACEGKLDECEISFDSRAAVGVVLASGGYPGAYETKKPISGLADVDAEHTKVFHAATEKVSDNLVTTGGRVLCVTSLGVTVTEAQANAYAAVAKISWDGMFYRKDIAYRAIAREQA